MGFLVVAEHGLGLLFCERVHGLWLFTHGLDLEICSSITCKSATDSDPQQNHFAFLEEKLSYFQRSVDSQVIVAIGLRPRVHF